jgi:hypothetical protein
MAYRGPKMGGTTNMASPFRTSTKLLSDKEQNAVSLKAFSGKVARWHIFKPKESQIG